MHLNGYLWFLKTLQVKYVYVSFVLRKYLYSDS